MAKLAPRNLLGTYQTHIALLLLFQSIIIECGDIYE